MVSPKITKNATLQLHRLEFLHDFNQRSVTFKSPFLTFFSSYGNPKPKFLNDLACNYQSLLGQPSNDFKLYLRPLSPLVWFLRACNYAKRPKMWIIHFQMCIQSSECINKLTLKGFKGM